MTFPRHEKVLSTERSPFALLIQANVNGRRIGEQTAHIAGIWRPLRQIAGCLIGYSVRSFRGPWTPWRDQEDSGHGSRHNGTPVPRDLRLIALRHDGMFAGLHTDAHLAEHESDVLILLESASNHDLTAALAVVEQHAEICLHSVHHGEHRNGQPGMLDVEDGISNLQWERTHEPARYRDLVYTSASHEHPLLCNGTYGAFRRYRLNLDKWKSSEFCLQNKDHMYCGDDARRRTLGRAGGCGRIVDRTSGTILNEVDDHSQAARAYIESHVYQAHPRGAGYTNFHSEVSVRDARILRRSYESPSDVAGTRDLLFLCFQSNLRKTGFEFIHNQWLMSNFNGRCDPLLDPRQGIVKPLNGCYYFFPDWKDYPGDCFADTR